MPLAAARAATALPRLPVDAQASVSAPSSAAFAAATRDDAVLEGVRRVRVVELQEELADPERRARAAARRRAVSSPGPPEACVGAPPSAAAPRSARASAGLPRSARASLPARPHPSRRRVRAGRSSAGRFRLRQPGTPLRRPCISVLQRPSTLLAILLKMKFYRIDDLPPYVFATVDQLKRELRREGRDVVDLGFGNPDLRRPRSRSRSCAKPRSGRRTTATPRAAGSSNCGGGRRALRALVRRHARSGDAGAEHDRRQGGARALLWVLASTGDTVVVPTPAYPIHRVAPRLAGATVVDAPAEGGIDAIAAAVEASRPASYRLLSAQPDHGRRHRRRDAAARRPGARARVRARARLRVRRHRLRRPQAAVGPRRRRRRRMRGRALQPHQVVLDGGLARRLRRRLRRGRRGARKAEVVPRLRDVPADPDRGHRHPPRGGRLSTRALRRSTAAGATRSAPASPVPAGTSSRRSGRCSSGRRCPEQLRALGSLEAAVRLARDAGVAVSPGVGFGAGGEGHVRFALVENEQRIGQATRGIGSCC